MVQDGQVGREHHRQFGEAQGVGGRDRQPFPAADGVVAHHADHPSGQRWQALDRGGGQRGDRVPQGIGGYAVDGHPPRRVADPVRVAVELGERGMTCCPDD